MDNAKLTLYKLNKSVQNDIQVSESTLDEFAKLNKNGLNGELPTELYFKAFALKNDGRFVDSFLMFEQALKLAEDDAEIFLDCHNELNKFNGLIERLAIENIYDLRIASLYELLIQKKRIALLTHAFVVLHYLKTGEKEKGELLLKKINLVAPNLRILKDVNKDINTNTKKGA